MPPNGESDRGAPESSRQRLGRPTDDRRQPIRLLIIDDEPSICQALSMLFTWHGLEVITALSAAEAQEAIGAASFDVLLIDLRLRDARGDAVFRSAVDRQPALRDRTLFMTGDITAEAERIIAATNCPFLRKPFDITLAVQAIAALLGVAYQATGALPPPPRGEPLGDFNEGKAG